MVLTFDLALTYYLSTDANFNQNRKWFIASINVYVERVYLCKGAVSAGHMTAAFCDQVCPAGASRWVSVKHQCEGHSCSRVSVRVGGRLHGSLVLTVCSGLTDILQ